MTRTGNISNLLFWLDDDVGLPLLGRGVLEHLWLSHRSAWQKALKAPDGQDGWPPLQHHPALQGPRQCPQARRQALYWERGPPSNYVILRMPTAVSAYVSLFLSLSVFLFAFVFVFVLQWRPGGCCSLVADELAMVFCETIDAAKTIQTAKLQSNSMGGPRAEKFRQAKKICEAFAFTWAEHRRISQKSARHTEKSPRWKIR